LPRDKRGLCLRAVSVCHVRVECRLGKQKSRFSTNILASSRVVVNAATVRLLSVIYRHSFTGPWQVGDTDRGIVCCSRETDNEMFMTRSFNVAEDNRTEQNLVVRSLKLQQLIINDCTRGTVLLKLTRLTESIALLLCDSFLSTNAGLCSFANTSDINLVKGPKCCFFFVKCYRNQRGYRKFYIYQ